VALRVCCLGITGVYSVVAHRITEGLEKYDLYLYIIYHVRILIIYLLIIQMFLNMRYASCRTSHIGQELHVMRANMTYQTGKHVHVLSGIPEAGHRANGFSLKYGALGPRPDMAVSG